ncbi:MAG: hypothetical protein HOE61_02240 [Candidatus Marinimicrobia bacterium]|jgi:hypothetical protein|nr:hypothetical protein [Candidatus Neomarinimicrobiota bacterium]
MAKGKNSHAVVYGAYSGGKQKYVTFYSEMTDHPAFRDLTAHAQALFLRLGMEWAKTRHKLGDQNGRFQMATSRIQEYLNISEYHAIKAMHQLIEHGYVEVMELERWTQRQSRKYRLCWLPVGDSEPGKDWLRWKKGKPVFDVPKHRNSEGKTKQRPKPFRPPNPNHLGKSDPNHLGLCKSENEETMNYEDKEQHSDPNHLGEFIVTIPIGKRTATKNTVKHRAKVRAVSRQLNIFLPKPFLGKRCSAAAQFTKSQKNSCWKIKLSTLPEEVAA